MSLTDTVARMIHGSFKDVVSANPELTIKDVRRRTDSVITHKHPISSILVGYSLSVGDILQPINIKAVEVCGAMTIIHPADRFLVYKLSSESSVYNPLDFNQNSDVTSRLKVIILSYQGVGTDSFDTNDVTSIIMSSVYHEMRTLIESCSITTNIAHKID